MARSKSTFKSKLNNLGAILAVVGVTMTASDEVRNFCVQLVSMLPEHYRPLALSALGALIVVLRTFFTTQPVELRPAKDSIE